MLSLQGTTLLQLLSWLVPGIIISFVRSRFLTGRMEGGEPSVRGALGISLVYAAVLFPIIGDPARIDSGRATAGFYAYVVLIPIAVGFCLGLMAQHEPTRRLGDKLGLKLIHDIPSAWDFVFARRQPRWVLVTLKDETKYRGCYAGKSFASSEPQERDLFLDQLSVLDEATDEWMPKPGRSILICKDMISTIELFDNAGAAP